MSDDPEPQYLTLKERIAALQQQQASDAASPNSNNALTPIIRANKPPPPPPPAKPPVSDRPLNNLRTQSVPNGSVISTSIGNMPAKEVAPPPILDREIQIKEQNLRLSERNLRKPPPLPGRKLTDSGGSPSPTIPQRRPSDQLAVVAAVRKPSNESLKSTYSNHSTYSYGGTKSSASSVNTEYMRRLPPPLSEAELPKLPPSKRELEEKARLEKASRAAAQTSKSTSSVPRITRQIEAAPVMPGLPSRPSTQSRPTPPLPGRPSLPSRPTNGTNGDSAAAPPIPARPRVNHGVTGFCHGVEAKPPMPQRPSASSNFSNQPPPAPVGPAVVDLTPSTFDSVAMSGKPALVFFHLPYCKYCKPVFPIYDELGANYQHASDRLTICKVDGAEHTSLNETFSVESWPTIMWFDGRGGEPQVFNMQRDLESLTRFVKQKSGIKPGAPLPNGGGGGAPPPIPTSSRPSAGQIEAIRARQAQAVSQAATENVASDANACLVCRNFSAPDAVGAQYPRQSIPRGSAVDYLAHHLCSPFSSQTDKARAIFTWCHHNIDYDFAAFLAKNIKHQSAEEGIRSGLGVCENYASIFCAIAVKAGMECVVVGGHGKGYGHTDLAPGQPIPSFDGNHAWNAVRIDGGRWKLIDACWGAGHLGEDKLYHRQFSPQHFCSSNIEFGRSHFPEKQQFFYREDNRILTWEEYFLGPPGDQQPKVHLYDVEKHGISKEGFEPKHKSIDVSTPRSIRFKFETLCQHWDFHKNGSGDPYLFCLRVPKKPGMGYAEDLLPMDFDPKAKVWWLDVKTSMLGKKGEEVILVTIDTLGGKEARGVTKREFPSRVRGNAMSFGYVAKWELA